MSSTTPSATTSTTRRRARSSAPSRSCSTSPPPARPKAGFARSTAALTEAIESAEAAFKRSGKTVGVATGFIDLDKKLGGLHPSDLIILAGRPSMGKTALATNIAFNAAKAYRAAAGPTGARSPRTARSSASSRSKCRPSSSPPASSPRNRASPPTGSAAARCGREDFDKFVLASQRLAAVPLYHRRHPGAAASRRCAPARGG